MICMAKKHLTDGKETCIPKETKLFIFKDKKCKICDSNEFALFDDSFLCCIKCGTCAKILSHPYDAGHMTKGIGFKKPRKKKGKRKGKKTKRDERHDVFIQHFNKVAKDYNKKN